MDDIEPKTYAGKNYLVCDGTWYHWDTPHQVIRILEKARKDQTRIRVFLGYQDTALDWNEEHDCEGRIARSTGPIKVPLIIERESSMDGPPITTECVIGVRETSGDKRVLYKHPKYHTRPMVKKPGDKAGYAVDIWQGDEVYVRFETEKAADRFLDKMELERNTFPREMKATLPERREKYARKR